MKITLKQRQKMKEYASRPENKIKRKEYMKKYLVKYDKKNKGRIKERKRIYYLKNKQKINERNKRWMSKNKKRFMGYRKIYDVVNKEKLLAYGKKWYDSQDKKEYRKKKRTWEANSRENNLNYLIKKRLRTRIWKAFKYYLETNKMMSSKEYGISYSKIIKKLIAELPKDFDKNIYEIDHIKPLCSFDLTNPEEVKKAFTPENHQWLTKEENSKKVSSDLKQRI